MLEKLRRFKFSYSLYNFFKKDELKHNIPLFEKYGLNKKYYSPLSSEDFKGMEGEKNIYDRLDSRTELPKDPDFRNLDTKTQEALLPWSEKGYAIIEGFLSPSEVDEVNAEVDKLISNGEVSWRYGNKIMFAIHKSDLLYRIGARDRLIHIMSILLGKKVTLFQSINFLTGSRQRTHSDSVHMTTFPEGNLIAAWIALEDIKAGSGELHYYPGSHKLPYIMNADYDNVGSKLMLGPYNYSHYEDRIQKEIDDRQLEKEVFLAKKGDVLIWHANLLHGGEPVVDENLTRKSMVFHYYTDDAICYHEITQRPSLKKAH